MVQNVFLMRSFFSDSTLQNLSYKVLLYFQFFVDLQIKILIRTIL